MSTSATAGLFTRRAPPDVRRQQSSGRPLLLQPRWSNGTVGRLLEPCPFHSVVDETVGACRPIIGERLWVKACCSGCLEFRFRSSFWYGYSAGCTSNVVLADRCTTTQRTLVCHFRKLAAGICRLRSSIEGSRRSCQRTWERGKACARKRREQARTVQNDMDVRGGCLPALPGRTLRQS